MKAEQLSDSTLIDTWPQAQANLSICRMDRSTTCQSSLINQYWLSLTTWSRSIRFCKQRSHLMVSITIEPGVDLRHCSEVILDFTVLWELQRCKAWWSWASVSFVDWYSMKISIYRLNVDVNPWGTTVVLYTSRWLQRLQLSLATW